MSIDVNQLKNFVVMPALTALGMNSPAAVNLILGTAAQETNMGSFIVQQGIGDKGGLGIYQMEQRTYNDIWDNFINNNIAIKAKIKLYLGYEGRPLATRMISDFALSTIMCRLFYYIISKPLPDANNIQELGKFYKTYFNTDMGKATVEQFVENYHRFVLQDI